MLTVVNHPPPAGSNRSHETMTVRNLGAGPVALCGHVVFGSRDMSEAKPTDAAEGSRFSLRRSHNDEDDLRLDAFGDETLPSGASITFVFGYARESVRDQMRDAARHSSDIVHAWPSSNTMFNNAEEAVFLAFDGATPAGHSDLVAYHAYSKGVYNVSGRVVGDALTPDSSWCGAFEC